MSNRVLLKAHLTLVLLWVPAFAQTSAKKDAAGQDFSKEGAVFEQITTRVVFQSDGTYTSEFRAQVRVQSDAGVRQYGVLRVPYQASVGGVEVQDVRVTKPNGSVVSTPLDSIQDMTSEVSREAPMYSDLREKHVAVKGLEPGDTLEYSVRWQVEEPLAAGQFWYGYQFIKSGNCSRRAAGDQRSARTRSETQESNDSANDARGKQPSRLYMENIKSRKRERGGTKKSPEL